MWPENKAFSAKLPTLQLFWDSVSTGALKKCPRYYQLAIVEGWSAKTKKVDLEFGIYLHAARERYYHARASAQTHEQALDAALNYALTATWDERTQRPWQGDNYKNRFTLAQCVVDYCDKWEHDPLLTCIQHDGRPAVEVSFRFPLNFGPTNARVYDAQTDEGGESEEQFWLCGHLDRVVEFQERLWISDLKSTRHTIDPHYFAQFSPDNQMSIYTLAGQFVLRSKIAGIIIDACQVLATMPPRFGRALIERTEAQLSEFVRGLYVLLRQAEYYARHNFWPMNERACFGCEFRGICSRSPSVRDAWLRADFTKRIWDPTQVRGDV